MNSGPVLHKDWSKALLFEGPILGFDVWLQDLGNIIRTSNRLPKTTLQYPTFRGFNTAQEGI